MNRQTPKKSILHVRAGFAKTAHGIVSLAARHIHGEARIVLAEMGAIVSFYILFFTILSS